MSSTVAFCTQRRNVDVPRCVLLSVVWSDNRNIVSTVNLDCKLDPKAIALQTRHSEYKPKVRLLSKMYSMFVLFFQFLFCM